MTGSSSGGAAAAGGVGHEGRCLAWVAAYMLAERPLPPWASGRRVVSIGGQTERAVDDVGFVVDDGGWILIQAKKNLKIAKAASSPLAEALEQLVAVEELGVPDRPPATARIRRIDSDSDRVLLLTDHDAPDTINKYLAPVTDRLRELPSTFPLTDVHRNEGEERALAIVLEHLRRLWAARHGSPPGEADLRRLGSLLAVQAMSLVDGGADFHAVQNLLSDVAPNPGDARRIWEKLEREAQRIGEERSFIDRESLLRRLEVAGVPLRPVARLRPDVGRLRQITDTNVALLAGSLTITAPEGPVAVDRDIATVVVSSDGNTAVTGAAGAGKSVVLHSVAATAVQRGADVVMLRSTDLQATAGQTRMELNLVHDLVEVLTGWGGNTPGLLLIDGLDQTSGTDASAWLPELAQGLTGTRWRIVATIRLYDLKHGQPWRRMFAGEPIDREHADSGLAQIRHVVVADLVDGEILQLRAASLELARLLDSANDRLRGLLTNPFNLDLAGRMLRDGVMLDFSALRSRADLLHKYWQYRVGDGLEAVVALRAVVDSMVRQGRQVTNPAELAPGLSSQALTDLRRTSVLRELPTSPGHASALIEFSHPVLFDYAVAMLALGDTSRPDSLADRLDEDPNLAIRVRPSLEYRLATVWRDDSDRRSYWRLALRLASRTAGHLLAGSAATSVAADEIQSLADCLTLADACTGTLEDDHGRWDVDDARGLTFLLAAGISRGPSGVEPFAALAALVNHLVQHAGASDDANLATLAVQLPTRALANRPEDLAPFMAEHLVPAAVTSMKIALADPADPRRALLTTVASRLLAHATVADPDSSRPAVERLCTPDMLRALGIQAFIPLLERIPDIARQDPTLAVDIGAVAFEYEETRDEQTSLGASAIIPMTTNRKDELDALRHMVAARYKTLIEVDPTAAASLFLRALNPPTESPERLVRREFPVPPHPRYERNLRFIRRHGVLLAMTKDFLDGLTIFAEGISPAVANGTAVSPELADIVDRTVAGLRHHEVWERLLLRAATTGSPALALALTPALQVPNLFADPSTWLAAGHLARRLSPLLSAQEHAKLETAIWGMVDAGSSPGLTDPERADRFRSRRDMIISSLKQGDVADERIRHRIAEMQQDPYAPALDDLHETDLDDPNERGWRSEPPEPDSPSGLQQQLSEIGNQLGSDDKEARRQAGQHLINMWASLGPMPDSVEVPDANDFDVRPDDVRLQAAERLTRLPQTTPESPLGTEVYSTLRAFLPAPAHAGQEHGHAWSGSSLPAWSASQENCAIEGLTVLAGRADWRAIRGEELNALIVPLLDSPNPVHRYLATRALPSLYPELGRLFDEAQHRLDTETDQHIATYLFDLISDFRSFRAADVDNVLRWLARSPEWACASAAPEDDDQEGGDERWTLVVNLLTALAIIEATPYASSILDAWMTHPTDHPNRATQATAWMRNVLNPTETRLRSAQERAFQLLRQSVDHLRTDWATAQQSDPTPEHREHLADVIRLAANIGQQLYYASTANDAREATDAQPKADARRFFTLALPLLEGLSGVRYPSVTHEIVRTLDHLRTVRPRPALLAAAAAVTGDPGYSRESLALDAVHGMVRHYLAEQRELLLTDRDSMSAVRLMLETYIRAGWDEAAQLAEELDDLFG